jgi:flagellar biogenesis protein FliO
MPSLIAILGTCLTAAAVAAAADMPDVRPGDRDAAPPWANSSAGDPTAARPQAAGYGVAADDLRSKAAAPAQAAPVDGAAGLAPDPRPASGRPVPHGDVEPAVFQKEADSLATRLAAAAEPLAEPSKGDVPAATPRPTPDNVLRPTPAKPLSADPQSAGPYSAFPARTSGQPPVPFAARSSGTLATTATAIATSGSAASIPLGNAGKGPLAKASPLEAVCTVGGSLSVVLGLFLVVAWAMRKAAPRGALVLPKEVFEILGRASLGARQQVQLLRCGSKLLLISITPQGAETLTEVIDPVEVDRIAGICQQGNPKSSTSAFRQVFQQLATADPTPASGHPTNGSAKTPATDDLQLAGPRRKRYRWEEKHA